jgi:hypothetical protein
MLANTKIASPLSRKAVLVAVNISMWTARRLDKKVTDEVNQAHNASSDAGRYNKLLLNATRLKRLTELVSRARDLHYGMTKPWADEGPRILPNVLYAKFTTQFRELKRDFHQAADDFCRDYPTFVEEAKQRLNGLWKAEDYPSAEEIRTKFKLDLTFMPLPEASDFRSDVLDDDTVADIRAEITAASEEAEVRATRDTVDQIVKVVGHMAKKLGEYKTNGDAGEGRKFFTDSLVANVRELAELLPAFNLQDDPALTAITERINRELCAEEAPTLRNNDDVRAVVQKSAEEILADVERFMA